MQDLKVGINARHLKQRAMKSKNLGSLGSEGYQYQTKIKTGIGIKYASEPDTRTLGDKYLFYSKENMEALKKEVQGKTPEEILALTGIQTYTFKDGTKMISGYHAPTAWCTYKMLGIDENELLRDVVCINGNCDLTGSYLKNLGSVREINRVLTIPIFNHLEDLSSLKKVRFIECEAQDKETVEETLSKLNLQCSTEGINYCCVYSEHFNEALRAYMASQLYE